MIDNGKRGGSDLSLFYWQKNPRIVRGFKSGNAGVQKAGDRVISVKKNAVVCTGG